MTGSEWEQWSAGDEPFPAAAGDAPAMIGVRGGRVRLHLRSGTWIEMPWIDALKMGLDVGSSAAVAAATVDVPADVFATSAFAAAAAAKAAWNRRLP